MFTAALSKKILETNLMFIMEERISKLWHTYNEIKSE